MSTLKKILALSLALAMVLSVSAFAGNYTADTYQDVNAIDSGAAEAVEVLYALKVMVGNTNTATGKTEFRPNDTITRAEVAKMIYVILNYGNDDKAEAYKAANIFADVTADDWFAGYVNYLAAVGMVQGDGTNFYPRQAVKTAEVAKMLLTAVGYKAEDHGYVGAGWSSNVLNDAYYIQLLDGYKANLNGDAPRQWVAVMFFNALMNAYTYDVTVPTGFTGYFGNDTISGANKWVRFGYKYLGVATDTLVAYATTNASIATYQDKAGTKKFAEDYVLFSNGEEIKNTGLGAMDLGQTYRIVYKDGKTKAAYSVRSLYETAEARALDIDVEVTYGTSGNVANNKYAFTVEDVTAKFAAKEINVLKTGTTQQDKAAAETMTVTQFYDLVNKPAASNDTYKVILNGNGEIKYIIVTEYDYAPVTKAATHNRYGDYVVVGDLTFNNMSNLYVNDCILTSDELAYGNYVKYTWDLDEGMYAMEVLPVVEDVVYSELDKNTSPRIYNVGGEDYYVAKKSIPTGTGNEAIYPADWFNNTKNLDEAVNLVVDGDLIVYRWTDPESSIDNMDEINAQLVLLLDWDDTYSTGTLREKKVIEYMTIDKDRVIAEYQDKNGFVQYSEVMRTKQLDDDMTSADLKGRLFILHKGTQNRVYLEELDKDAVNEQLNASASLLNQYEEGYGKLDATDSPVKFGGDAMAADNKFFYAYIDGGEAVFDVITPADFGAGYDEEAYGQLLSYVKSPSGRTTVLGGYIVADLVSDTSKNFLYITDIGRYTDDGWKLTVQVLGEEDTRIIYVDGEKFYTDLLYSYTYKTMTGEWTLDLVDEYEAADGENYDAGFHAGRIVKDYDEEYYEIYLKYSNAFVDDTILDVSGKAVDFIVVTTIDYVRDETQENPDDSYYLYDQYDEYNRELKVVDYEDLTEEDVVYGEDTASYEQYSYWFYSGDVLYIVVLRDMTRAQ